MFSLNLSSLCLIYHHYFQIIFQKKPKGVLKENSTCRRGKPSNAPPPKNASLHEKEDTQLPPGPPNKLPPAARTKPSPPPTKPPTPPTKHPPPRTETSPGTLTKARARGVSTC